jgi:anti-sigma factor ChrR (cupin superfamily)
MQHSHSPETTNVNDCEKAELACAYALEVLPTSEVPAIQGHLAACLVCQREVGSLQPILSRFISWPTDVLRPSSSLQTRLALGIAEESGTSPVLPAMHQWSEPAWEQVAPGIECKLLATDTVRHRVSMLVRLAPGASYPGHTHAGVEELHLLDGELWIDQRKLFPGEYYHAAPGSNDDRVWSETGCTCVLLTSTRDILR